MSIANAGVVPFNNCKVIALMISLLVQSLFGGNLAKNMKAIHSFYTYTGFFWCSNSF